MSFFANQNTDIVSLHFFDYTLQNIPVYIVVGATLLIGLFVSWFISIVTSIATSFTLHGKESKIKHNTKENAELLKRIHQLELENTRLTSKSDQEDDKSL